MLRLAQAFLLVALLLPSVPTADAQIGRLFNRARQAVTGNDTPAEAQASAESPATLDGRPAPTLDYTRFLEKRYWPLRGQYYFSDPTDHLIFPPAGLDAYADDHGEYVVRDADGRVAGRQRLGSMSTTRSNAFMTLGTYGAPDWGGALTDGSYTLDLVFRGRIASRIPFTVEVRDGGDPFDPKTLHLRDGPWRSLAYFHHETDRRDYQLHANGWVSAAELGQENGRVRITLTRGGEPIATCKTSSCPHVNTGGDWGSFSEHLVTWDSRDATNATFFTIDDVTPGEYLLTVSELESGREIRSYAIQGGADGFVPHARSAMEHEPRYEYLTTRRIRGSSLNRMESVYWAEIAE